MIRVPLYITCCLVHGAVVCAVSIAAIADRWCVWLRQWRWTSLSSLVQIMDVINAATWTPPIPRYLCPSRKSIPLLLNGLRSVTKQGKAKDLPGEHGGVDLVRHVLVDDVASRGCVQLVQLAAPALWVEAQQCGQVLGQLVLRHVLSWTHN